MKPIGFDAASDAPGPAASGRRRGIGTLVNVLSASRVSDSLGRLRGNGTAPASGVDASVAMSVSGCAEASATGPPAGSAALAETLPAGGGCDTAAPSPSPAADAAVSAGEMGGPVAGSAIDAGV